MVAVANADDVIPTTVRTHKDKYRQTYMETYSQTTDTHTQLSEFEREERRERKRERLREREKGEYQGKRDIWGGGEGEQGREREGREAEKNIGRA
jgi:hypothetical protein